MSKKTTFVSQTGVEHTTTSSNKQDLVQSESDVKVEPSATPPVPERFVITRVPSFAGISRFSRAKRTYSRSEISEILEVVKEKQAKKATGPPLESLCKQVEYAAKIDAMWDAVKTKTQEEDYGTACAAVYKTAVWLGLIDKEVKASQWKPMLHHRYGCSITEAMSKYNFIKPPNSAPFRNAVINAFGVAEKSVALIAKNNPLPSVYHRIPKIGKS